MLHNASIVGFAEGTHVLMADGKWKTIEQVKEGDMVMSFNPDLPDSELEPRKVVDTWHGIHRDCIEVHQQNKVTVVAKDQLFFAPGATWLQGFNTKEVVDYNGDITSIQTRKVRGGKWKIYDITVDGTHAFIANDMRVHNKKKKVPQPVVTAGKPGKPVTVSTTTKKNGTTTVTVYPSPGSSAQISAAANGSLTARQTVTPGVGADYVAYETIRILPYPAVYQYSDRVSNAQAIRDGVCGSILSKGSNYKVKSADVRAWNAQFTDLLNELNAIKGDRGIRYMPGVNGRSNMMALYQDPTAINDAINEVNSLKKELKAGKKINFTTATSHCARVEGILDRISRQCGGGSFVHPIYRVPQPSVQAPEAPVSPAPENYFSDRIYEDNANYNYYTKIGCTYVFDPPNAPAQTTVKYYKHLDPNTSKYYYDRLSNGAIC